MAKVPIIMGSKSDLGHAEKIKEALAAHEEYLKQEVLAVEVVFGAPPRGATTEEQRVNGERVVLGVKRRG